MEKISKSRMMGSIMRKVGITSHGNRITILWALNACLMIMPLLGSGGYSGNSFRILRC